MTPADLRPAPSVACSRLSRSCWIGRRARARRRRRRRCWRRDGARGQSRAARHHRHPAPRPARRLRPCRRAHPGPRRSGRRAACGRRTPSRTCPQTLPAHASILTGRTAAAPRPAPERRRPAGRRRADAGRRSSRRPGIAPAPSSAPSSSTIATGSAAASTSTTIGCRPVAATASSTPSGGPTRSSRPPGTGSSPPGTSPWLAWVHLFDPHAPVRRAAAGAAGPRAVRRRGGLYRRDARPAARSARARPACWIARWSSSPPITARGSATTASARTGCSPTTPPSPSR